MSRKAAKRIAWTLACSAPLWVALLVFGCSLRTMPPTVRLTVRNFRDNPELAEMTRFAVIFSGGAANSLSAADVNQRNLTCLKLNGQVSFPYTLAELKQGVAIAVAPGSYTVRIVGYSDVTGTPTTVPQMFSGSSTLKSFAIAEASLNTTTTSSVQLTSTYVKATATDLIVACPTPQNELQSAYLVESNLYLLNYSGEMWTQTLSATAENLGFYSLHVDSQRSARFSYIDASSGGYVLRYGQRVNGTLSYETIRTATENSPHAIVTDFSGTTYVLAKDDPPNGERARLFRKDAGWIDEGVRLSQATGINDIQLAASPIDNSLLAVSASVLGGGPVHVEQRSSGGVWSTVGEWSTAGAYPCGNGTTKMGVSYDGLGFGHIVYECIGAAVHLGYLTNRSGIWTTHDLTPTDLPAPTSSLNLSLDDTNQLHVLFGVQNQLRYIKGDPQTLTFNPQDTVYDSSVALRDTAMKAISGTEVRALISELDGDFQLHALELRQGEWTRGPAISVFSVPLTVTAPIF